MAISTMFGAAVKRKEDPRLIAGEGLYTDDLNLPGTLHLAFLRSPHAHANITRIDTSAAKNLPGVVTVLTGEDITESPGPLPVGVAAQGVLLTPTHYPLAVGRVRFVGDGVAAVLAESAAVAHDAVSLIDVEYEPLPAVVDAEAALAEGAPQLWDEIPNNRARRQDIVAGDVDGAFSQADRVIRLTVVNQRVSPVALEPRAVQAQYERRSGQLTVWSSTQIPHLLRTLLAILTGVSEAKIRVIAPDVGGGFGSKLNFYADELLVPHLAMRYGKPVKYTETRSDNLASTIHGRDQVHHLEAAVRNDGFVLGIRDHIIANYGAYSQLLTPGIPGFTMLMLPGVYRIPAVEIHLDEVYTNKMSTDAYRGAGRPEATFALERLMDFIADDLGLDPAEVRRRNFVGPNEFPYTTTTGLVYDSGDYEPTLTKALETIGAADVPRRKEEARRENKYIGLGYTTYVEICGVGPSAVFGMAGLQAGGYESATVRLHPTGKATVITGTSPHGQGLDTAFSQLVSSELGIPFEDIEVIHGDTANTPYGIGTFGSRSAAVGGTAIYQAAAKIKEKAMKIGAHLLEASDQDMVFDQGRVYVRGVPQTALTIQEISGIAHLAHNMPSGVEPGMEATSFFDPPNFTFPFGTHATLVEVDGDTGEVKILDYVAVDDVGNVINPLLVDGQIHGGIAQGVAQALFEETVYDEHGQLISGTLMDYAVPKAHDLVQFRLDRTVTPSPSNPMGVKGVGEAGTIAAASAVVNAVIDALEPFGVRHLDMPLKPEKVWRAMQQGRQAQPSQ